MKERNLCDPVRGKASNGVNLRFLICVICVLNLAFAPAVVHKVKEGNKLYEKEDYDEALKKYTDAQIDRPESPELFSNIAGILYKQRKYSEAESMLEKAIPQSDVQLEAKIYYNIGNCKYRQGQLRESIDYYKKALELNPGDTDAKYNIEFVEKKIKEMMSQAKERQEKQEQEPQRAQREEAEGGAPASAGREKAQQETQAVEEKAMGETHAQEQKPEEKKEEAKPEELSKEEAEALLRMIADDEKSAGEPEDRTRRRPGYYPEVEKTW